MGLSFDGDPTTVRERKGYLEKVVRKRLRRLKAVMAALEVIMVCWSLYTTVRYFLAFAIYASYTNGYAASLILATLSLVSVAVLFAAAAIPFLQTYLLGRNITITALLTVRTVLRYAASSLLLVPAAVNFALVFAWRHSALAAGDRCAVDLDVVWPIHSHAGCAPPPWDAWLALAIVRLVLTGAILTIYHLALASYQHTRRPSLWRSSTFSESSGTYLGSPPMSMSVTPLPHEHTHQPSMSTLGSGSGNSHSNSPNSKPPPDRRSLRSSRSRGSSMHPGSPSTGETNLRLPRLTDSPRSSNDSGAQDEFDPYADLPPLPPGHSAPSPPRCRRATAS
ncbi:hypothetical protein B0H14DRAFT_310049 [Mycena olivaceomarginata]|nr:hypothetical protein B0H14DRAFT_310049 [Mycena olivaceomarginata]